MLMVRHSISSDIILSSVLTVDYCSTNVCKYKTECQFPRIDEDVLFISDWVR